MFHGVVGLAVQKDAWGQQPNSLYTKGFVVDLFTPRHRFETVYAFCIYCVRIIKQLAWLLLVILVLNIGNSL